MTTFRKTYAAELAEALAVALLAIVLVTQFTTRTVAGVAFLVLWMVAMARIGAIVMSWSLDRRPTPTPKERAASMSRHPSARPFPKSVEDHYSGPRKVVKTHDGAAIMTAPTDGSKPRMVHNHGPHEGPGLACPEYGAKDGSLRGACVIEEARQRRATEETWTDPLTGRTWDL